MKKPNVKKYERFYEFIQKFDEEANRLVREKREQFEREEDVMGYMKLDGIQEDMLSTCIQLLDGEMHSMPSLAKSMLLFLDSVAGVGWMKDKYRYVECLYERLMFEDGLGEQAEMERLDTAISAVYILFRVVFFTLQINGVLDTGDWMTFGNTVRFPFEK